MGRTGPHSSTRARGRVSAEGDDLFYKVTGDGAPILMIAGGGGDGDSFLPLADQLRDRFMVITYDRRSNARSTANDPSAFSVPQQARDAVAVLRAVGLESADILGSSSGAVIALELARAHPDSIRRAIFHEPPLTRWARDPEKWQAFFEDCYRVSQTKGASKAATKFGAGVLGRLTVAPLLADLTLKRYLRDEPKQADEIRIPARMTDSIFIDHELLPVTGYEPDVEALRRMSKNLTFTAGEWTVRKGIWLADVAQSLADETDSAFLTLPGSHVSYMDKAARWASVVASTFTAGRQ
ncbi:alpha/beta fold hydrolase [Microbacterium sp. NPDC057650]|uniref:alpha/beta fold hydrolase n=1 Tax=unclassified Microbacterium TaxID=2609290 RepID=UPI0036734892